MRNTICIVAAIVVLAVLVLSWMQKSIDLFALAISAAFLFLAYFFQRQANYFLILGSVAFTLGIAEYLSGFAKDSTHFYFTKGYKSDQRDVRHYGIVPSPGSHRVKKIGNGEMLYSVTHTIGDDGFRVTTQQASSKNSFRVNFFGGSFTYGEGLEDDETLPYYFARLSDKYEVKNWGMHGWGVHNALAILESSDVGGEINILVTGAFHALRSSCFYDWTRHHPFYKIDDDGKLVYAGRCKEVVNSANQGKSVFAEFSDYCDLCSLIKDLYPVRLSEDMITNYLSIIERIQADSHKNNQKLIVGYLRDWRFHSVESDQEVFRAISNIADGVVDITLAESIDSLPDDLIIHALDRHPSAKANEKRAKLLLNAM